MLPRRLERLPKTVFDDGAVAHEANSFASRLLGLAFLPELPPGHALFIPHCHSVHTFGMRFAIDLAFVDDLGIPLRIERSVPRRRILTQRGAFSVIECRAGEIERFLLGVPT
jgi:uncharacterized membrane protein (UPF0127 family)